MLSGLLGLIFLIAILGVILYFIEELPMSPPIRTLIRVVIIITIIVVLLRMLGVGAGVSMPVLR